MENKNFTKSVTLNTVTVLGMNMKTLAPETREFDTLYNVLSKYSSDDFTACKIMDVQTITVKKALPIDKFIANAEIIENPTPKAGTITRTIGKTLVHYTELTKDDKINKGSFTVNGELELPKVRKAIREFLPTDSVYRVDSFVVKQVSYRMSNEKYIELANKEAEKGKQA
jgi:hypothetical protein